MCGHGLARGYALHERSGVMGREREADGAWRRDLEQLRKDLKPGDRIVYRKMARTGDERILDLMDVTAAVKEKYPHLVRVEIPGDRECPVRTMTYMEILTDWFRKSGDKQESNRKERGRCLKNLENLTPAKN